jgi:hypothetical protein
MQANYARPVSVLEVATDRVLNHRTQLFDSVGLRENRMAEAARLETAFRRFFDGEDNLG